MKFHTLTLIALCAVSAEAKTVDDIFKSTSDLLAHEPKVMSPSVATAMGLDSAKSQEQPWTGSYWPDITGSIANHYRDRTKLGNEIGFLLRYDASKARFRKDHRDVRKNYLNWDQDTLNQKTAPSEKYDLLVGNKNFEFTQAVMEEVDFRSEHKVSRHGDENYAWTKRKGGFPYWSGICDGWAPAAIYLPRPVKPVTVTGASGLPITFYPDDLKALGSYLFARANTPYFATMSYRFAGNACKQKGQPDVDKVGFVSDRKCNDLDAGVWHLALLNRIGIDRMGFEMDIDNNQKINNHPVFGYSVKYFNPKTGRVGSFEKSTVSRSDLDDLYSTRRDSRAVQIVGVKSKVQFSYYNWPEKNRDRMYDSPDLDKFKSVEYIYDLELDADGKILGGEWGNRSKDIAPSDSEDEEFVYSKQPDFIWMAPVDQLPYSQMSLSTIKGKWKNAQFEWAWNGTSSIPEDWIVAAREDQKWTPPEVGDSNSKLKSAQVLSNLIYVLFSMAK